MLRPDSKPPTSGQGKPLANAQRKERKRGGWLPGWRGENFAINHVMPQQQLQQQHQLKLNEKQQQQQYQQQL